MELQQRIESLLNHELLENVPKNPTIEELETLIAIEQGRAYRIKVDRNKLEPMGKCIEKELFVANAHGEYRYCSETSVVSQRYQKADPNTVWSYSSTTKSELVRKIYNGSISLVIDDVICHHRKYIWRTFCLSFKGKRLLDDEAVVSQLGIAQDSVLTFTKLAFDKGNHRPAWRRRHHS